ncbi:MAG: hypothetical protein WC876_07325 [Candidatus Thermoplasmatota archaeon]|jgi:hypothetical protein
MQNSVPLAALLLGVLLAGCTFDTHRPTTVTPTPEPTPEPEGDSGVMDVTIESDGSAVVEIPFSHLDSCRSAEDWMAGQASVEGAVPDLRNATGNRTGRVLVLATRAERAEWSVQIPLGPACQTFRYDPWSIDPDRDDGTVEVRVTQGDVSLVTVLVRRFRDGAGEATLYEGQPTDNAWTALPQKAVVPI